MIRHEQVRMLFWIKIKHGEKASQGYSRVKFQESHESTALRVKMGWKKVTVTSSKEAKKSQRYW